MSSSYIILLTSFWLLYIYSAMVSSNIFQQQILFLVSVYSSYEILRRAVAVGVG